jgi:hypothetical protein
VTIWSHGPGSSWLARELPVLAEKLFCKFDARAFQGVEDEWTEKGFIASGRVLIPLFDRSKAFR